MRKDISGKQNCKTTDPHEDRSDTQTHPFQPKSLLATSTNYRAYTQAVAVTVKCCADSRVTSKACTATTHALAEACHKVPARILAGSNIRPQGAQQYTACFAPLKFIFRSNQGHCFEGLAVSQIKSTAVKLPHLQIDPGWINIKFCLENVSYCS